MDIKQLVNSITPEVYANLKYSIEIGKWPDGKVMSEEQKALSIQAIIAYEAIKDVLFILYRQLERILTQF